MAHIDFMKKQVEAFNNHLKLDRKIKLEGLEENKSIIDIGEQLVKISKQLEKLINDPDKRYIMAHLEVEELGEMLIALGKGDEVEYTDAQADRLYIFIGSIIATDTPIVAAFNEVHKSNMTKSKQPDDPSAARVRSKGPDYVEPNIAGILKKHKERIK